MNDDTLIVTETEGDTFDLQLSESSTPETFRRRASMTSWYVSIVASIV